MKDKFDREHSYVRLSITQNCNLRCRYCVSDDTQHKNVNITNVRNTLEMFRKVGIKHIRLTGGEPLCNKNILDICKTCKEVLPKVDLSMSTNGMMLSKFAKKLKEAGLDRVNISLDTLDPILHKWLTRGGNINRVFEGLEAAKKVFDLVKVNCVVTNANLHEVPRFADLVKKGFVVRFIEYMALEKKLQHVNMDVVRKLVLNHGNQYQQCKVLGQGPACYYKSKRGTVGFIQYTDPTFCDDCNRVRVQADGTLVPCLLDNNVYKLHGNVEDMCAVYKKALQEKPFKGVENRYKTLATIGG